MEQKAGAQVSAPLEVLWGPDGLTLVIIILYLLIVGVAFAVLDRSGLLKSASGRMVGAFGGRKYPLLLVISFFFMYFLGLDAAISYGPF